MHFLLIAKHWKRQCYTCHYIVLQFQLNWLSIQTYQFTGWEKSCYAIPWRIPVFTEIHTSKNNFVCSEFTWSPDITWWCFLRPKLNLDTSLWKEQSPLRLAARIWKIRTKQLTTSFKTQLKLSTNTIHSPITCMFISWSHLWAGQVLEVVKPIHMRPAVVKGMDELMCNHSVHVGLLVNIILTQNNLEMGRGENNWYLTDVIQSTQCSMWTCTQR